MQAPACDSECYLRHHLCAVREVRRLRALLEEFTDAPKEEHDSYAHVRLRLEFTQSELAKAQQRIAELESRRDEPEPEGRMVPESWLAEANRRITELNVILIKQKGLVAL